MMMLCSHKVIASCTGQSVFMCRAHAGVSPGLFFDWAIPLMTAFVTDAAQADEGSVYWALSALQHGLQRCDDKAVTRYGNALLDACQRLLEADTLPEHLLPLLLLVISQVILTASSKLTGKQYPISRSRLMNYGALPMFMECAISACHCLQATRAEHSFKAHFQDLVELLVGWSFEPKLIDAQR